MTEDLNTSDAELVQLSLEDSANFYLLMKRYESKLLRYIKRITSVSQEGAEDVLQEVFIKVYRNLRDFDTSLKFSSWIYRITHNEVISRHRKKTSRAETVSYHRDDEEGQNLIELIQDTFDTQEDFVSREIAHEVQKAIMGLPDKYREILILRYLEQKDYEEISDILRKSLGTVSTLINRAKKHFSREAHRLELDSLL